MKRNGFLKTKAYSENIELILEYVDKIVTWF